MADPSPPNDPLRLLISMRPGGQWQRRCSSGCHGNLQASERKETVTSQREQVQRPHLVLVWPQGTESNLWAGSDAPPCLLGPTHDTPLVEIRSPRSTETLGACETFGGYAKKGEALS
ncbi:hypothetical protein P7K49_034652 [Saguinus oedipus]|uniref:Uncharacterized protein n=1 Tax=Saguinus oedipus TaxID=9490 RepID=A0ABQ9TVB6_SAGOE|nr:hypothetical protein P7K49_034652 [Saguinus oedipus]